MMAVKTFESHPQNIADLLAMPDAANVEFEPPLLGKILVVAQYDDQKVESRRDDSNSDLSKLAERRPNPRR
jgi:hypothetical protein